MQSSVYLDHTPDNISIPQFFLDSCLSTTNNPNAIPCFINEDKEDARIVLSDVT